MATKHRSKPASQTAASTRTPDVPTSEHLALLLTEFDAEHYASQVHLPKATEVELAIHYATTGWKQGLDPSPQFSVRKYLDAYPDVNAWGKDPLFHFVKFGRSEGRQAFGIDSKADQTDETIFKEPGRETTEAKEPREFAHEAQFFDETFYLKSYPDVAKTKSGALKHYMEHGWKEGRDPSPDFSTHYYLESNPDVRDAGIPPLTHYALTGKTEGRQAKHLGGWRASLLARTSSLSERVVAWKKKAPYKLLTPQKLQEALATLPGAGSAQAMKLVLALSHDRYYENTGGIQACIQEEQLRLNAAGYGYVSINPYQPLPALSTEDTTCWLADVSVNGALVGTMPGDEALSALRLYMQKAENHLCVHSLLGHSPSWVEKLANAAPMRTRHFWVHDYFTVCAGFNLLRNDVSYCNAPAVDSNACQLCVYGDSRQQHLARMKALFEAVPFTVLAPSQSAMDLWKEKSRLPYEAAHVIEHRTFQPENVKRAKKGKSEKIRVAFLGHPVAHKGWFLFKDLVAALRHDSRYEFMHLGLSPDKALPVAHVPVKFTANTPAAMQDAIERNAVDIALVLSEWPETFCLIAYEAMAGGACVFAMERSGNVEAAVKKTGNGKVFPHFEALRDEFSSGGAAAYAKARLEQGVRLQSLQSSGMSVNEILRGAHREALPEAKSNKRATVISRPGHSAIARKTPKAAQQ